MQMIREMGRGKGGGGTYKVNQCPNKLAQSRPSGDEIDPITLYSLNITS